MHFVVPQKTQNQSRGANSMRKKLLVLPVVLSVVMLVGAITVRVWVYGSGSSTESDRSSAMSEAIDQATQQANAICTGVVVTNETTGSFCTTTGNDEDGTTQYACTAMVKALCEIQGRGR
jgi:flagellar basal body-associated protein FliL